MLKHPRSHQTMQPSKILVKMSAPKPYSYSHIQKNPELCLRHM
uniref:Uncharacterized protein n=1 Tax=Anguilla anguilla TaxID=7936 RepID=A0A0E9RI20_ANGAN